MRTLTPTDLLYQFGRLLLLTEIKAYCPLRALLLTLCKTSASENKHRKTKIFYINEWEPGVDEEDQNR